MSPQNNRKHSFWGTKNIWRVVLTIITILAVCGGFLPSQVQPAKADANSDVNTFVGRHVGVYTSAPNPVNSGSTPGSKLGNGDVRVVIGDASSAQTLYVSKSDFWTVSGGGYGNVPLNVGGITIRIAGLNGSSYRLEQDILHAEVRGIFTINGQTVTERSYVAATDNLIVTNLSLSGGNSMSVSVDTWTKLADGGRSVLPTSTGIDNNAPVSTYATRETWPGAWTSRVAMATRVLDATSSFSTSGSNKATSTFTLTAAQPVTIVTAVDGGKNVTNHLSTASSHVKVQTTGGLATLNTNHRNWWQSFYTKAYLDLGGDKLEEFWYAQQYALASTNRAGKIAPGLYGWITTDNPSWGGDYHLNYNFQGPYYGVFSSNHPELALPYFDPILAFVPTGKSNATNLLGRPGVYYPVGIGPWNITTDGAFHQQKENAVFAALDFIYYYYATKDTAWLNTVYSPFLKEVANFWEADLVLNGNRWEVRNSAAREDNNPAGNLNPMPDVTLLKYFFKAMIDMSTDLNVDSGKRAQWQDYINRMSALPTGAHNGITVFKQAENMADSSFSPGDNPINFYAVFPAAGSVGLSSSASQLQIARDTITQMNSWNEGNSFILTYSAAARAGWNAQDLYNRFLTRLGGMGGDFLIYEGGGGLQTTGGTETVNSMLMQSHEDVLRVFPAWPTSRNARFVSLRAKGAFTVSSQMTGGIVLSVDFHSEKGSSMTFQNPWSGVAVTDTTTGGNVGFSTNGNQITFGTTAGHDYHMVSGSGGGPTPTRTPTPGGGEAPYGGTRWNLPGTVEAENYDTGGQNVGYSKPTAGTSGYVYRSDAAAQIETTTDTGGGADVGWTNTNDWYKYMVNVTSAGTYNLNVRAASPNTGSTYHVEVDGIDVTGTMTVPNTGGWQTYQTLTKTGVSLTAGAHTLRLYVNNGGMNFNWIGISGGGPTATPGPGGNLALNKATTADGTCATNEASQYAVDGVNTTKWCANGAAPHWLQIDLGSAQNVTQFVIRHASSGGETTDYNTRDFTIQTSTDGTTWTTRVTVTGNSAATTTHNITSVSAQYIKLNITVPSINDPNTAARIYEFQVY